MDAHVEEAADQQPDETGQQDPDKVSAHCARSVFGSGSRSESGASETSPVTGSISYGMPVGSWGIWRIYPAAPSARHDGAGCPVRCRYAAAMRFSMPS